jgi:hypothetical protein
VLKRTPGRVVYRELRGDGTCVVKSFRRGGLLGGARARRRARREASVATFLAEAGLPAPRALGVERRDGAWCVVLEQVRAARALGRWLEGPPRWPNSPASLARDAGRLLARLQLAGLAQPDWHPDNLLLDRRGVWHAIDFHLARIARPSPARGAREAARLAGALLGRVDRRLLILAHRAWAGCWLRAGVQQEDAQAFLGRAAESRGSVVERHLGRWTRESGVISDQAGLLARRDAARVAQEAAAILARARGAGPCARLEVDGRDLVVLRGAPRRLQQVWNDAARLLEHGLPGLRPLARPARQPRWALFELEAAPPITSEAALTRLDERGLEWTPRVPPTPRWWPLSASDGDQASPSDSSSSRLTRTKSRMRGTSSRRSNSA